MGGGGKGDAAFAERGLELLTWLWTQLMEEMEAVGAQEEMRGVRVTVMRSRTPVVYMMTCRLM
jgi:hypothetical protein